MHEKGGSLRWFFLGVIASGLLGACPALAAGGSALTGKVVDASTRAPLADVVVIVTSPALQGERVRARRRPGDLLGPVLPGTALHRRFRARPGWQRLMTLPNQWSPRVGLIYDFTGHGRSKVFASYARYYENVPAPARRPWIRTSRRNPPTISSPAPSTSSSPTRASGSPTREDTRTASLRT